MRSSDLRVRSRTPWRRSVAIAAALCAGSVAPLASAQTTWAVEGTTPSYGEFNAPPLIWAAEGSRTSRTDRDHAAVGQLLLNAGSPVEWQTGAEPAESIVEIVRAWTAGRPQATSTG